MHFSLLPGLIQHEVRQTLFPNHNTARQHHTNISQGSVLWKAFPKHQPQKTAPSSLPWHQEEDWWQQCSGLCLYLGLEQQDGVFARGCVSHTAQGLNASLTHPCSVNTDATCCCVCGCVFRLLVCGVVYCILFNGRATVAPHITRRQVCLQPRCVPATNEIIVRLHRFDQYHTHSQIQTTDTCFIYEIS